MCQLVPHLEWMVCDLSATGKRSSGGSIVFSNVVNIRVVDCTMENNSAVLGGSAIYSTGVATTQTLVENCTRASLPTVALFLPLVVLIRHKHVGLVSLAVDIVTPGCAQM